MRRWFKAFEGQIDPLRCYRRSGICMAQPAASLVVLLIGSGIVGNDAVAASSAISWLQVEFLRLDNPCATGHATCPTECRSITCGARNLMRQIIAGVEARRRLEGNRNPDLSVCNRGMVRRGPDGPMLVFLREEWSGSNSLGKTRPAEAFHLPRDRHTNPRDDPRLCGGRHMFVCPPTRWATKPPSHGQPTPGYMPRHDKKLDKHGPSASTWDFRPPSG